MNEISAAMKLRAKHAQTSGCKGCMYLCEVVGHPWNTKGTFTHGRITETKCYGCTVEPGVVVLFDNRLNGCEMFTRKESE